MAFQAKMNIGGTEYRVLHCSFELHRDVDGIGLVASKVKGGQINLEIEATDDHSTWDWMVDEFATKDGKVTFMKSDSNAKLIELEWKKGYVVQFSQSFDSLGDNPMTVHFTVSAHEISLGGTKHTNPWPKS